eukprot:6182507-Pleurochrysis_carterae.AAC.2
MLTRACVHGPQTQAAARRQGDLGRLLPRRIHVRQAVRAIRAAHPFLSPLALSPRSPRLSSGSRTAALSLRPAPSPSACRLFSSPSWALTSPLVHSRPPKCKV